MKKIAALGVALSMLGSVASAQVTPTPAPQVNIVGGLGASGALLAIIPLVLLAALAGNGTNKTPGQK